MLIDTHCHLDFPAFDPDREEVLARARESGINYCVNIGATLESSAKSVELAAKYPQIFATVGLHPHDADLFNAQAQDKLRALAGNKKVVAVGESGLDYYRNLSSKENQKKAFRWQINLAKELGLPLVIHSRQAEEETLQILKEETASKAVVHCFSGNKDFLDTCLGYGFLISYTCNITYKKAEGLREMVKLTPLDRMLLETDAPYLSPEGFRGKRNEPAQVKLLAQEVSRIKGISLAEVAQATTQNATAFFNLK